MLGIWIGVNVILYYFWGKEGGGATFCTCMLNFELNFLVWECSYSFQGSFDPDPPFFLAFFFFLISLLFRFPLFVCEFFLSFPRIFFRGSAKRKTLAFLGVSLAFFQKSKGWRVRAFPGQAIRITWLTLKSTIADVIVGMEESEPHCRCRGRSNFDKLG